ncbi:uncharacterized protein LOC128892111 [Hylaeus anthracinus]|uniref:uncharacterized protein LOC128892111 n=1 Tax=Hylaeus anthracinus TaxID=313031 RepID=UPI0023BA2451|nr:uncharacterized protein LOC128892111 [Hylaeus anthracinus]
MCRSNFRIKLDLCKFYNDVRRFCWIFVDGAKMLQISHLMEHITKLFNMKESFHLLLNEIEYLPPNEDIRVLKENETISVCPGSGLENGPDLFTHTVTESENNVMKIERNNYSIQHKESQTNLSPQKINSMLVQENLSNDILNRSQRDILETSTTCSRTEDDTVSMVDSKTNDSILINDVSISEDCVLAKKRRRRTRQKKPKYVKQPVVEEENKPKKPKIINSYIISSSKHIRFDNADTEEVLIKDVIQGETRNEYLNKESPPHELANLLSLGQNSVPATFTNTKVKEEIKVEHMSDEETNHNMSFENTNESISLSKELQEGKELSNKDISACPVMTTKPQIKDFVGFKMLKIGVDYTPQVSEFIVAEVISYCPTTLMYTFKVLQGLSELQVPVGKFTLVQDDEERVINDTITLNSAQLIEPRLVSSSNSDKTPTSINNCSN